MNPYYQNPLRAFINLTTIWKVILVVAVISAGVSLHQWGQARGESRAKAKYEAERTENLKQAQAALAGMEAANKRAEAQEAQAELIAEQNTPKAKAAQDERAQLEQQEQVTDAQIKQTYERDRAFINSDLSQCDRCRDICARTDRLAATNPALAEFRCSTSACAAACATQ